MTFTWPWALLGLLALPALAVIYWLRQRARRRPVSSLMLWRETPQHRASGRRLERFESGRLFPLELLILALLALAAAGPQLLLQDSRRPLVVVLDDSFSMLAGEGSSPRSEAVAALKRELESERHGEVTLIAAGERPQVLGDGSLPADAVIQRLELWRPTAPTAELEAAIALAADVRPESGDPSRILVLTDQAPPGGELIGEGHLAWWAFGSEAPNVAWVSASRRPEGRGGASDVCLLEVANYAPRPVDAIVEMAIADQLPVEVAQQRIESGQSVRVRVPVPRGEPVQLQVAGVELASDVLAIDDRVVLLPEPRRRVRVALEIDAPELRRQIRETLIASERAILVSQAGGDQRAQLVVTDRAAERSVATWRLQLFTEGPAKPYLGPFVLDRGHPLAEGLALNGTIWGAPDAATGASGEWVVTAGEVPLIVDHLTRDGGHDLAIFWRPELSTLQQTPNWPILWWNLLDWRARSVPGVQAANLRLGAEATVGLMREAGDAELELPDGSRRRWTAPGDSLTIRAEQLGVHYLRHGGRTDRWAVNALSRNESDLRLAASGRWGGWRGEQATTQESRGIGWILLLMTAACLVWHLAWSGRR